MDVFLQTLVAGILKGGLYALIGIGMTLIMGVMGIINLAHGQLMMLAMYVTFVLNTMGVDPYFSLFVAMPLLFLLGVAIQKFLLNPLIKADTILPENQVLMTVGIGMVLTEIVRFIFSSDYKYITTTYSNQTFFLGNISFSMRPDDRVRNRHRLHRRHVLFPHQDRPRALHPGDRPGQGRGDPHGREHGAHHGDHLRPGLRARRRRGVPARAGVLHLSRTSGDPSRRRPSSSPSWAAWGRRWGPSSAG